jgi:hypothetical protein
VGRAMQQAAAMGQVRTARLLLAREKAAAAAAAAGQEGTACLWLALRLQMFTPPVDMFIGGHVLQLHAHAANSRSS